MEETLGKRLYEFACNFDPYGVQDDDYTLDKAISDVSELDSAQIVIGELLEIINNLMEE